MGELLINYGWECGDLSIPKTAVIMVIIESGIYAFFLNICDAEVYMVPITYISFLRAKFIGYILKLDKNAFAKAAMQLVGSILA